MIGERTCQEILPTRWNLHYYLSPAQTCFRLISYDVARDGDNVFEVRRDFQDGDRAERKFTLDGSAYPGLEMSVVPVVRHHIERNCAMSEQEFVAIDSRKIALETGYTGKPAGEHHRDQGRNVTLAAGRDAHCIQPGQCQTTSIMESIEKVKATEGKAAKMSALNDSEKGLEDSFGSFERP